MPLIHEPGALPRFEQTADAWIGIHHTGMLERQFTDVRLEATDYTADDEDLKPTPENITYWSDVLQKLGEYEVWVLEQSTDTLHAQARALGYQSFDEFAQELADTSDLQRMANLADNFTNAPDEAAS